MKTKFTWLASLLVLLTVALAHAQGLPTVTPEQVGLSSERFRHLMTTLRSDVEKGEIPGAIVFVARHGRIAWFEAVGMRDPQTKTPMTKDTIFRIYSMTKPITSVAAMILVEDGKLALGDPVSKYIPQLGKTMNVAVEKAATDGTKTEELVPVVREMTIHDLFRHSAGLTYGFFGDTPAKRAYLEKNVGRDRSITNAELIDQLASLPLGNQPGTTWTAEQLRQSVELARVGRRLTPKRWPNDARVAVCLSFDTDTEGPATFPVKRSEKPH